LRFFCLGYVDEITRKKKKNKLTNMNKENKERQGRKKKGLQN